MTDPVRRLKRICLPRRGSVTVSNINLCKLTTGCIHRRAADDIHTLAGQQIAILIVGLETGNVGLDLLNAGGEAGCCNCRCRRAADEPDELRPHAASPRPAASAMAGTTMSFFESFIVLPSPQRFCLNRSPQCPGGHHQRSAKNWWSEPELSSNW